MRFHASIHRHTFDTPLGGMLLATTERGVAGLWFEGQKHLPDFQNWPIQAHAKWMQQAQQEVTEYFAGERQTFDVPLDLEGGTAFQQSVWRTLLGIAWGTSLSYGQVSQRLHRPLAVRAVANAVGRNPVSLIVPCHRVLGADQSLTGYAGGLDRKRDLLMREGVLR
jgi:methylated-DNA-[protein]-cysteine S-methyltransferase